MKRKIITTVFLLFSPLYLLLITETCISQYKSDFRVNDDIGGAYQNMAKLDVDKNGNFVVVWQDQRNVSGQQQNFDVYCQRFNFRGEALGINFKVNLFDSTAFSPNIAIRPDGSFVVVWKEGIYIGQWVDMARFYIRIYSKNGVPLSNRIAASDSTHFFCYDDVAGIGVNSISEIFVVMAISSTSYTHPDIYLQKFDSNGNKIGLNQKVNDDTSYLYDQKNPDITVRENNSFIVVWNDNRLHNGAESDIFMQRFNSISQPIGINLKVNDDTYPVVPHLRPSISSDSLGKFGIVWNDTRESGGSFWDVYIQFFNENGGFLGNNFRVCFGLQWDRFFPIIKKRKDGYSVVGWSDNYANGYNWCPFFLRYSNTNQIIGYQHPVTNFNPSQMKTFGDITLWEDRIISAWSDYRNSNADIFCNILSFQNPDSIISSVSLNKQLINDKFTLEQNYPNPFNSRTNIEYEINKNDYYKLEIFNILGQYIETVFNEYKIKGSYRITFDSLDLTSGCYYYRLISSDNIYLTKTFLIVK